MVGDYITDTSTIKVSDILKLTASSLLLIHFSGVELGDPNSQNESLIAMLTRSLRTSNLIIHSICVPTLTHRMSSTAATKQKHEWIVILPDNVGMLPKRMEVRP